MKTIYDIMYLMYENWFVGCPCICCQTCPKHDFCIADVLQITREYIEREGVI